MAGDDLVRGVDDGDQRPCYLDVGETVSLEQAAMGGFGQPALHAVARACHAHYTFPCGTAAPISRPHETRVAADRISPRDLSSKRGRHDDETAKARALTPSPGRELLAPAVPPRLTLGLLGELDESRRRASTRAAGNGCHRPGLVARPRAKIVRERYGRSFVRVAQGRVSRRPAPGFQRPRLSGARIGLYLSPSTPCVFGWVPSIREGLYPDKVPKHPASGVPR